MSQTSDDECLGCDTGCDYDGSHRDESGNYHPNCCTRAAEIERMPQSNARPITYHAEAEVVNSDDKELQV